MQINQIQPTTFGQNPILKQMKYKLGLAGMLLSELGYAAKDIFEDEAKLKDMKYDDYVKYSSKLIEEGKYTLSEPR